MIPRHPRRLRFGASILLWAIFCATAFPRQALAYPPVYGYQIVHTYPHDRSAFTEGLFYLDGYLYESTGLENYSQIRKENLETAQVLQTHVLPPGYFGEGITSWRNELIQLTWRNEVGFVYNLADFKLERQFSYSGEGWALTQNGHQLIMSDGTAEIRFLDPVTLKESHRITVTYNGSPVQQINELEWMKGEILANVWLTNDIARINPRTGEVVGVIDLTGILPPADRSGLQDDVLNGIAYDAKGDRLFVTGKRWPKLFEIRLVKKADGG